MRPSLLLLDEPTSFLDLNAATRLSGCLHNLRQSCLITTHHLSFVKNLCDRFLFLDRGDLRWSCRRQELAGYLADEGWEN